MYTKKQLKQVVKHAYEMQLNTHETVVLFQIYAGGMYVLDTEEDNVIEVTDTEQDAINIIQGLKEEGCKDVYYKPILADVDSGERVTRENFQYYDLESDWVKNYIKDYNKDVYET